MNARALVPLLTGILGCAVGVVIGLSLREKPGPAGEPKLSSDAPRRPVPQRAETATAPSETSAVPSKPAGAVEAEANKEWTEDEAIAAAARASALPEGPEKFSALDAVVRFAHERYRTVESAAPLLAVLDQATADLIRVSILSELDLGSSRNKRNAELHAASEEIARILHSYAGKPRHLERLGVKAAWVAWYLAKENPVAATEWASALPPEGQKPALEVAIDFWSRKDAVAASEWLRRQKPGPLRDAATLYLIRAIEHENPEGALAWASSLTDIRKAQSTRKAIFQLWAERDLEHAFPALQQLTEEERKFILSRTPDLKSR